MHYRSAVTIASRSAPGVELQIRKASFARRLEIMRRIRDLSEQMDRLRAAGGARATMDAILIGAAVDRIYVSCGVAEVTGLELDGRPATPAALAEGGPEALFQEALRAVREQFEQKEDGNGR